MRFLEVGESMLSPRNEHHFIGSIFSAIGNAMSTSDTNDSNERQAQLNRSFQRQEAQKTRDWQEKMWNKQNEYNSPEAMISRGLNPFTQGASGTGASVPTGAQAGSVSTLLIVTGKQIGRASCRERVSSPV